MNLTDVPAPPAWPDGIDCATFLRDYWQKRPLLMRGALPGFRSPLDADELAGLACDADVESRLVMEHGKPPWQVRQGPFSEQELTQLPQQGWSLLVQDVDKHLPDLATIGDSFNFLPAWRFDDLMVSCAPPGGSVGAHIDAYDVFLLQGQGERTWSIGEPIDKARYQPQAQLRVLADFTPSSTWTLRPGDALYLPPGIPHHGVAGSNCVTWSVGFRAPSHAELAQAAGVRLKIQPEEKQLYDDPDLASDEAQEGLVSAKAIDRAHRILALYSDEPPPSDHCWFGELVTQPKAWLRAEPLAFNGSAAELASRVANGESLMRHGMARLARSADERWLFADGDSIALTAGSQRLARQICSQRRLTPERLAAALKQAPSLELLALLVGRGQLCLEADCNEASD